MTTHKSLLASAEASDAVSWLLKAGPVAARLNFESKFDVDLGANAVPAPGFRPSDRAAARLAGSRFNRLSQGGENV